MSEYFPPMHFVDAESYNLPHVDGDFFPPMHVDADSDDLPPLYFVDAESDDLPPPMPKLRRSYKVKCPFCSNYGNAQIIPRFESMICDLHKHDLLHGVEMSNRRKASKKQINLYSGEYGCEEVTNLIMEFVFNP